MTDHFVDDTAIGDNDGTTKTHAWVSMASATGVTLGDTILVAHTHDESKGGFWTLAFAEGDILTKILSINFTGDALTAGAKLATGSSGADFTLEGALYVHGVHLNRGDELFIKPGQLIVLDQCDITADQTASSPQVQVIGGRLVLINPLIDNKDNGDVQEQILQVLARGEVEVYGWRPSPALPSVGFTVVDANDYVKLDVYACDLDGIAKPINNFGNQQMGTAMLHACELETSFTKPDHPQNTSPYYLYESSAAGTITDPPLGLSMIRHTAGEILSSLSRYRTGGADDGEQANAHSWELITTANVTPGCWGLRTPWMSVWNGATTEQTYKIFLAGGATLNDDQFWIEILGPSDATPITAKGFWTQTRVDPQTTPSALTTDSSSTWNGTGVGTKQEVSITYTPKIAGPVQIRCHFAKPSATVYVDAKIDVS